MGSKARSAETLNSQASHRVTHRQCIQRSIDSIIASLPDPAQAFARRTAWTHRALYSRSRGQFHLLDDRDLSSLSSSHARRVIEDNLRDEVSQNHPGMLRRFAMAAGAVPTDVDHFAVHQRLHVLRNYIARLRGNELLLMMAFFEGFIAQFMSYFARLAIKQGSLECEYTNVHGVIVIWLIQKSC